MLWHVDQSVVHQSWNFYNVLVMSDFTQDGVPEVLLSQGGDPKFDAKVNTKLKIAVQLILLFNLQLKSTYVNI